MSRQFFTEPTTKKGILQRMRLGDKLGAVMEKTGKKKCGTCKKIEAVLNGEKIQESTQ